AVNATIPRDTCAIGEISLTGQVRPAPRLEQRLREAARLGFTTAVVPKPRRSSAAHNTQSHNKSNALHVPNIKLVEVDSLRQALNALGIQR
ncbi:MAG: DNA repair protein RadA, partial [Bifidobacterium crudilactis]|nr:DNA repair protein RadA [Bifidobacterium crudilactis]